MALNNLPFNWFDITFVAVLGFGLWRGRRNGMSKEVMPLFQWLSLVLVCGTYYPLIAPTYTSSLGADKVVSAILGYGTLALAVWLIFYVLRGIFVPRLTGSNFFGGGEYYLGMASGLIRFACMLLAALALLHARHYTQADIQASKDYNNRTFGGGMKGYSGDLFPSVQKVQEEVFKKSYTGPYLTNYIGSLLIDTTPENVNQQKNQQTKKPGIKTKK